MPDLRDTHNTIGVLSFPKNWWGEAAASAPVTSTEAPDFDVERLRAYIQKELRVAQARCDAIETPPDQRSLWTGYRLAMQRVLVRTAPPLRLSPEPPRQDDAPTMPSDAI